STTRLQSPPAFQARHPALRNVNQLPLDNRSHLVLLLFDRSSCIDYGEAKFVNHLLIPVADDTLKKTKALLDIVAQEQVHSSLVVLEPRSRAEYAFERDIERHSEIKSNRWFHREPVELSDPVTVHASSGIPSKGCVDVAICQDDRPSFQWRYYVTF